MDDFNKILAQAIRAQNESIEQRRRPCVFCLNARSDPDNELTDYNDASSFSIGKHAETYHGFFNTGDHRNINIEVTRWNPQENQNETVFRYFPKFCPQCGRDLRNDYPEMGKPWNA